MREFLQKASSVVRRFSLTVLVLGLLAGTGYAFLSGKDHHEALLLDTKLERVNLEIERVRRENRRLRLLIMNMHNSDELVDKIAREDAGLIKEGELLYLFPK